MTQYQLDLVYHEKSGRVVIVIDIHNSSLGPLDIHDAIADGSLREEVLRHIESHWGEGLAEEVRSGRIGMTCSDTSPQAAAELSSILRDVPLKTETDEGPGADPSSLKVPLRERNS